MAKKRITELATETTLKDGQYVAIDHATDGTKKYNIGAELTDLKEELEASIDNSPKAQEIADSVFNAIDGNSLVFVHFTDSHTGRSEMPPTRAKAHMEKAIRLAEAVNADFLIHTGDMIQGNGSNTGTSDLERYQSMIGLVSKSAVPFVWCQGNCNHDFGLIVDGAYTLRRTQVSTLAGRLHRHISPVYNNADTVSNTFKATWEVGAINNEGVEEDSTSHQRTGYYLLKRGETFRVMRDDLRVFFYSLDKTFKETLYNTEIGKYYVMSEDTYVRFRAYYSTTQPQYGLGWMNEYLTLYKSEIVNSYYYFDLPTQYARVIVLDSDDYGGNRDSWGWSSTQISWLTATLTDAKSKELPVLIFSHMPPSGNLMPSCPESGADVMSAVNAFTASGGTILAFISGHVHWDNYYNDAINNVPYIQMTCDLPVMTTEQFVPTWGTKVVPTRVIGEESEYAVDIYLINCMTKHTQIFRYGAGDNRDFSY